MNNVEASSALGDFFGGLSIRFVGCMMTMNWAVSRQQLLFGGSLRSCHELCLAYFSACQTVSV